MGEEDVSVEPKFNLAFKTYIVREREGREKGKKVKRVHFPKLSPLASFSAKRQAAARGGGRENLIENPGR